MLRIGEAGGRWGCCAAAGCVCVCVWAHDRNHHDFFAAEVAVRALPYLLLLALVLQVGGEGAVTAVARTRCVYAVMLLQ